MFVSMARKLNTPNPENATLQELIEAGRVGSSETAQRCTAIQMLIAGISREQVCAALLVALRSLQKWTKAFNETGIDGLIVKKGRGRKRIIQGEQANALAVLLDSPEQDQREFWTARTFHGYIREHFKIDCSYETVVRFFHEQGFARKVPQPWPDRQDEALRAAFQERLRELASDLDVDLWFSDESGFEGDPRPRQRWDRKGRKTRVTKNGDHVRMNAIGLVCPRTGEFFAIEASHVDSEMFQAFLDEANRTIRPVRKRNILIMDNASWHKGKSLDFGVFEPDFLPPYSPDFNPIERIWLVMKARWFNNHVCRDRQALLERLDKALLDVIGDPKSTKKTASMRTLF
jgi:transposase